MKLLQSSHFNKVFDQNFKGTKHIKVKIQLHYSHVADFGVGVPELTGMLELKLASTAVGKSPYT